ncbi:MAG: hypothetical protein QOJ35_306 [Solirubrobacteraceae bacterium]|jgi:predicted Ser/Thr protein kinase|nr:hypothetical protein [Solirubrobacteraceae bacterium]
MEGGDDSSQERTIGRYRLDGELGRGGMGVVYAAFDVRQGRAVALKVISPEIARDEAFAARFQREARIAISLEHPNVVPVYETGQEGGALFIAMRRVDGEDLGKVVRGTGPLPVDRVVRLARQIGSALDAAHARGLVHRDVKPGNVLLTGTGDEEHAYLTDFGLAREAASESGLTNTGQWMGTADYVAPEQIEGGTVSAVTDVYSLGCVLFELLTGDVPFTGLLMRKLFAHSQYALPTIGDVAGPNSGRIDEVLARATEKQPPLRYPSAGDLARALAAAAAGRPAPLNERSVATGAALTGLDTDALGLPDAEDVPAPGTRRRRPATADDATADEAAADQATADAAPVPAASKAAEPASAPVARAAAPRASPSPTLRRNLPAGPQAPGRPATPMGVWILALVVTIVGVAAAVVVAGNAGGGGAPSTTTPPIAGTPGTGTATEQPTGQPTDAGAGSVDTTSIPTTSTASTLGKLPAVSDETMRRDIQTLLRTFYATQIGGDYVALRKLTTNRYRRMHADVAQWRRNQQTGAFYFRDPQRITVEIVDRSPADGSVTVNARGMRYTQPGSPCKRWQGITWARWEEGRWKHDPNPGATTSRTADWQGRTNDIIGRGGRCIVR